MKKIRNLIVLMFLTLLAFSCDNEQIYHENVVDESQNFEIVELTSKEIPEITGHIDKKIENKWNSAVSKDEDQMFFVDRESAFSVKDADGNETFSFRMYVKDSDPNEVYNLVVDRRVDGNNSPDFVMRYTFSDENVDTYWEKEDKEFNGKVDAFSFESFLTTIGQSSKGPKPDPCFDDMGDPEESNAGANSSNGAGGGSNGSGSGYNGGANTTSGSNSWGSAGSMGYTGARSSGGRKKGSVEVGRGCFCAPKTKDQKYATNKGKDDCPKGEVVVVINVRPVNPVFFVNCGSFEFYAPPGSPITVAAVEGISEKFYSGRINKWNDEHHFIEIDITSRGYFIMPSFRRNGQAANITAEAITLANRATEAWFLFNFDATPEELSREWRDNMAISMAARGGTFTTRAPFAMKNAGKYQTSLFGSGDCD